MFVAAILGGLFLSLTTGLPADLNQYVLYRNQAWVAAPSFASVLAEFLLCGAPLTRLTPPTTARKEKPPGP